MRFPKLPMPERTWTRGLALLVVVAVVAAAGVAGYRMFTGLPDDAALKYHDDVITTSELDDRVDVLTALYGIQKPAGDKEKDKFERDVAKAVAVSLILDDAAKDRDIVISDKSARDTLASMVDNQLANSQKDFTALLAKFGIGEDDVLDEVKRQQAIALLFREVTKSDLDKLTADDVRAYYDQDPSRFATPEQRHLRNIVVATKRDANAVVAALRRGDDFRAVARTVSRDDATRDNGGDLGTVAQAELDPTFAEKAFAAKPGTVFGPVKTAYGWNVGQVVKVVPARQRPFAKIKDQVADTLRSERALEVWRDWLGDEIKDADVEYADDYRPEHPDEPPADAGVQARSAS
ncbi:peptidylprolyl isomerase [Nocardioides jensenii]|uniref:peptidylprolyl isomerase n=1 Tax=Nocardioides jensenii TaxID=1843 RepID=UPI000830A7DE|nr:peptidyl-prolyl cis-trans isomerase [Nocardioides jensenii]